MRGVGPIVVSGFHRACVRLRWTKLSRCVCGPQRAAYELDLGFLSIVVVAATLTRGGNFVQVTPMTPKSLQFLARPKRFQPI